jgi:HD-GYP domain-containing protein (c-di-GMP phosphodiesterase class II)
MDVYQRFLKRLFLNYFFGSLMAVFGVGATMIFSTLRLSMQDMFILSFIMIISTFVMFTCELLFVHKHLKPIRKAFTLDILQDEIIVRALKQLQKFPNLTVKRILLPHYLGITIPAVTLTQLSISIDLLKIPNVFVLYAVFGAFLLASIHALIEFFLTIQAVQPIGKVLKSKLTSDFNCNDTHFDTLVPIRKKYQITVLVIGIYPILIFLLAAQIKFTSMPNGNILLFWQWASLVLIISVILSVLTARFMARDIEKPIRKLQTGMKKVQNHDYQLLETNIYMDEFSQVFSGFNFMIEGIKQRENTNKQLLESFMATLSTALDARDPYTSGHSLRVGSFSYDLGRSVGLVKSDLDVLYRTALLHDIGKIGVPDTVLLKEGKLTDEEFDLIKAHPLIGVNILKQVQPAHEITALLPGVRSHHERIDGRGYPDGLKGEEIPYFGKIIAVADAFDAMTSDRPYRKGMSIEKALHILESGKDTQWDGELVDHFIEIIKSKQPKEYKTAVNA